MGIFEIFTLIGAVLGIIAFFQNFLVPYFNYNREKIKELNKIICIEDFEVLLNFYTSRIINWEINGKLNYFVELIKNNSDKLKFKYLFKNFYSKRYKEFLNLFNKYTDLVQTPFWELNSKDTSISNSYLKFNKKYFFEKAEKQNENKSEEIASKEMESHFENLYDIINEMKKVYLKLNQKASKELYNYVFFWVK